MTYKEAIELRNRMEKQASLDKQAQPGWNNGMPPVYVPGQNGALQPQAYQPDWEGMRTARAKAENQKYIASYVPNGVRTGFRGIMSPVAKGIRYGLNTIGDQLNNAHSAVDAAVNWNNPEHQGQNLAQRWDTANKRTSNSWSTAPNDWAENYWNYHQLGMDTVPGLAYTNDFETNYPAAKAIGEFGGNLIGGLGVGQLAGAVANPSTAPQWLNNGMQKMPQFVRSSFRTAVSAAKQLPRSGRSVIMRGVKSIPGMPKWLKNTMDLGNTGYGFYKSITKGSAPETPAASAPAPVMTASAKPAPQTPVAQPVQVPETPATASYTAVNDGFAQSPYAQNLSAWWPGAGY